MEKKKELQSTLLTNDSSFMRQRNKWKEVLASVFKYLVKFVIL